MNLTFRGQALQAINLFELCADRVRLQGAGRGLAFTDVFERATSYIPESVLKSADLMDRVHFHWVLEATRKVRPGTSIYANILELQGAGEIHMTCQRCLQPVLITVDVARIFDVVLTEQEADAAPMDDDEIDVIVGSKQFNMIELVEDELLLSMPIAPKHEDCHLFEQVQNDGAVEAEVKAVSASEKPNPFAKLAELKLNKK